MLNSDHANRLQKIGIEKDIEYCVEIDRYDNVPYLKGNALINL